MYAQEFQVLVFVFPQPDEKATLDFLVDRRVFLRRDPRVSLCVDDETLPFAFVQIYGTATLSDDPEQLVYWATRIGGRYMGADQAETYGKRNGVQGELIVRVTPSKVIAKKNVAG
jgi:PPOX class probable F420-dependent enzyme